MRVAVCGLGKAGERVINEVCNNSDAELACVFCRPGSEQAHMKISDIVTGSDCDAPVYPTDEAMEAFSVTAPDVLIDFSGKKAVQQLLSACMEARVNLVVGTTGFVARDIQRFRETVEKENRNAMICAPNITLGVNIMMYLSELTAACLPDHDFIITEKHYKKKADISGTAARLSERMSRVLGRSVAVNSVRAGGYVGLHEVLGAGENERITIIHESFSRRAFAQGALLAAKYLQGKTGWFDMDEVIAKFIREREDAMLDRFRTGSAAL